MQGSRLRGLVVICVIFLGATAAMQRPQIPTGGSIPDVRGFRGVNDPRYPDVIKNGMVTRRVAGQVYVIAGAGGNIAVQAGDDSLLLVDDNFKVVYDQIMANIRQISDTPIRVVVNTQLVLSSSSHTGTPVRNLRYRRPIFVSIPMRNCVKEAIP